MSDNERFEVSLGEEPEPYGRQTRPHDEGERLERLLDLVDEMDVAGFLPDHFRPEWLALKR